MRIMQWVHDAVFVDFGADTYTDVWSQAGSSKCCTFSNGAVCRLHIKICGNFMRGACRL